jgi:K+-transporting ATPase KdpF subunit
VRRCDRRVTMIWLTVVVTVLLFAYLLAAMLRPEKF